MGRRVFDGLENIKVLTGHEYRVVSRTGSHVKLRLDRTDLDSPRLVTVPLKPRDEISTSTFQSIARQRGAEDYGAWCDWNPESL